MASGDGLIIFFLMSFMQLLIVPSFSFPLCSDSTAPFTPKKPLVFCPQNGPVCCTSAEDSSIQKQFAAMNISNSGCASLVKSILCARCDKFSAELFTISSAPRQVPVLCNSTTTTDSFCSNVWDTCHNVSLLKSPFATPLLGQPGGPVNSTSKLADIWQTKTDFCDTFGGTPGNDSVCFNGGPVTLENTPPPSPPNGMCLEKIGNGTFLNMAAHPDGSSRAFFGSQPGKIYLATLPKDGSGGTMELDESNAFIDLTDEVYYNTEFGLMGIAFHPNFVQNGRFFASYNCDKSMWAGCNGICSCNSDVNCDPSKLTPDNGAQPCQYQAVISEYTANGTGSQPFVAAKPVETRRIFTMGLPFSSHHAGQILFGPSDGYLYFMMGDGGGVGDPYSFAQNKKSLLGKIIRLDIDGIPSASEINNLSLWGNYTIPKDNPYIEDTELQPEIWAFGLRNPWRCSFDSFRPSYFMCADIGQDTFEEVDIISKDGNYGWRAYEGPYIYNPPASPGGNTSLNSISPIFPVMGYNHSSVNNNVGSASITGGNFYRSMTDPCMYGSYLYADLYAGAVWAGIESPENSGNFTSYNIPFTCAKDTPIACSYVPGSSLPALGYIFSFGEDNNKDTYVLASSGVYRIVHPSRCNYACSKESITPTTSSTNSTHSDASQRHLMMGSCTYWVLLFSSFCLLFLGLV